MSKLKLPKAPDGYKFVVDRDFDAKHHAIWLHHSFPYSYTPEPVKTIWGFLRKKDMKIVSPINGKKPGKLAEYVTAYSAMPPPLDAPKIHVNLLYS